MNDNNRQWPPLEKKNTLCSVYFRISPNPVVNKMVVLTKLMKFFIFVALFLETWYAILSGWLPLELSPQIYQAILPVSIPLFN